MDSIIEVNQISKKFKYGESQPYYTLRDSLASFVKNHFCINNGYRELEKNEFWALKNVSFKINRGEVAGIIGPNGAGKSTLLKILSRITPPTSGNAIMRGRVGSLLEVGTGFQQELTGRENIYLNGAILGMRRHEINKKFDEIVEFSGVEKFLDMPVKHYSSGMYTRLAFSVAVNLESEILIIDEVLAVGDAEFQTKCLDKINEVTQSEGRTTLFVSHNMNSVEKLCKQCLLLDKGEVKMIGPTLEVVSKYNQSLKVSSGIINRIDRQGNGKIRITKIIFKDANDRPVSELVSGKNCRIDIFYDICSADVKNFDISIGIDSLSSCSRIGFIGSKIVSHKLIPKHDKPIKISINNLPFLSGKYSLTVYLDSYGVVLDWVEKASTFIVKANSPQTDRMSRPVGQGDTLIKYDIK
jgi:lipopolysaccharide transport system ATP-binding protein